MLKGYEISPVPSRTFSGSLLKSFAPWKTNARLLYDKPFNEKVRIRQSFILDTLRERKGQRVLAAQGMLRESSRARQRERERERP